MKRLIMMISICTLCFFTPSAYSGSSDEFDSEKMLSDLEKQLQLSREKLDKLKPALDAKSAELKESINESIDKGFVEMEKLSKKLDAVSKDAERKVQDILTSDEMVQLREYLSKLDKDAILEVKNTLIAEFTAILELTTEQAEKLKPILEDSFNQLAEMLDRLAKEGMKSLDGFKVQYDELIKDLRQKLEGTLDSKQLESLDNHSDELKNKIQKSVFI